MQEENFDKRKMSVAKQAAILAALCEGTPIRAVARIFRTEKQIITRMIREAGEAFADYMDKNFRDLPCLRIEMDEQWQYVGCHAGRLPKGDGTERGDYWLWACIDADTKLVFSHKVGKRDWITGYEFVGDVKTRVNGPVQIATDNMRAYPFHIRAPILDTKVTATEQRQRFSASRFYRTARWHVWDAMKASARW